MNLADKKVIGDRLRVASEETGKTYDELSAELSVDRSSWFRYMSGNLPKGMLQILDAALKLGLTPSALTLEYSAAGALSAEDEQDLQIMRDILVHMTVACPGAPKRPIRFWREQLAGVLEEMKAYTVVPTGTTIKAPEPGVRTYEPPDLGVVNAGEAPVAYGEKKKRKK